MRSGGEHSDPVLAVEVRRGTLIWSLRWRFGGKALILSLLFGSGGEHCDLELASGSGGALWSSGCCSGPAETTPITSSRLRAGMVQRGTWACCSGPVGNSLQLRSMQSRDGTVARDSRQSGQGLLTSPEPERAPRPPPHLPFPRVGGGLFKSKPQSASSFTNCGHLLQTCSYSTRTPTKPSRKRAWGFTDHAKMTKSVTMPQ